MDKRHSKVIYGMVTFYVTIGIISDLIIAIFLGILFKNFLVFLIALLVVAAFYIVLCFPIIAIAHIAEAIEDSAIFLATQSANEQRKNTDNKKPAKICPLCKTSNEHDSFFCVGCGAGLR